MIFNKEISNMRLLKDNMITSIDTLTADNNSLMEELGGIARE